MIKNKLLFNRDSNSLTAVFPSQTTGNYYPTKFESKQRSLNHSRLKTVDRHLLKNIRFSSSMYHFLKNIL